MHRYELTLFPKAVDRTAFHGGHFEMLAEALEEAGKHPECECEVRDLHDGGILVAWSRDS